MTNLYELVQEEIKNGNIPENYIEYNDKINLKYYNFKHFSKDELEEKISDSLLETNTDMYIINDYIQYLLTLDKFKEYEPEDFYDSYDIMYLIRDNIDFKVEDLIENTKLKAYFFPNQQDNLNSEGNQLFMNINDIFEDEKSGYPISPILKELFESQGYKLEDLKNEQLVEKSEFLSSFLNEISNLTSERCVLTILLKMPLDDFFEIYNTGKQIEINKDTYIGLFDPCCGGGSMFDIVLEKPFKFRVRDEYFEEYNFSGQLVNYGYDLDSVYGFTSEVWYENYKII